MAPVVAVALIWVVFSLDSGKRLADLLQAASLPVLIALIGVFVFQDHMRRRELRRYRMPDVD